MNERPHRLALSSLPLQDVQKRIDQQPTASKKAEVLTSLYCETPQVKQTVHQALGLQPERFVGMFSDSLSPLLEVLPKGYDLEFAFFPGEERDFSLPALRCRAFILSKGGQTVLKERYGEANTHPKYIEDIIFDASGWDETASAGRFGMAFFGESLADTDFTFLMSTYTSLTSHDDLYRLKDEEKYRVVPVPLRVSEGSTVSISDAIRTVQENLLSSIAEEKGSIGIVMTTPPISSSGVKMLERQGYTYFSDLSKLHPQLRNLPNTTTFKKLDSDDYYGKLIFLPTP